MARQQYKKYTDEELAQVASKKKPVDLSHITYRGALAPKKVAPTKQQASYTIPDRPASLMGVTPYGTTATGQPQSAFGALQAIGTPQVDAMTAAQINSSRPKLGEAVSTFQRENPLYTPPGKGLIDKIGRAEEAVTGLFGFKPSDEEEFPSLYERTQRKELTSNPLQRFISGAANTASFGLTGQLEKKAFGPLAEEGRDSRSYKTGELAGMFLAPGQRAAAAMARGIVPGAGRVATGIRGALTGGILGAGSQAGVETTDIAFGGNVSPLERLKRVGATGAFGVGLGAAGEVIFPLLGKGARAILERFRKPVPAPAPTLALPMGRADAARMRGQMETPDVITPEYQFGLPRGAKDQSQNIATGRAEMDVIDNELNRMRQKYIADRDAEYRYLKESMKNRGGVQQGGVIRDPKTGEVLDRFGRISNNPLWYQEFYRINKRTPTDKDLRELANKHMQEGFEDELGMVPSWLERNQVNDTIQALKETRETLSKSIGDLSPRSKFIVPDELVSKELSFKPKRAEAPQNSETVPPMPTARTSGGPAPARQNVSSRTGESIPAPVRDEFMPAGGETAPRFGQRIAETAPSNLADAIRTQKATAPTTTHVDMIERAAAMFERLGEEGTIARILSKTGGLSDAENVAAQQLIKKLASSGSPEDLQTSIDLVSKVGRSGREMGQAINALKLWDKLDTAGLMRMAERELNKGTREGAERVKPTAEQVKPLTDIADKLKVVEHANDLTSDVMKMLAAKAPGEALTPAERAIVADYQKAMQDANAILTPMKSKLKRANAKTIQDVEKVVPKKRTRDEVVNYLDAVADAAREELRRQRNIGIIAGGKNPVIEWAKIGAAKVAKGLVKFTDWAAEMRKDGINERLGEVFQKSVERFRKVSGIPTDQQINRIVNNALKKNAVDQETADAIRALGAEIGFYDGAVRKELMQDLHMSLNNLSKPSLGDYPASLQRMGLLLTPVTQIKNILGNAGEYAMRKASDASVLPIDWARSKLTGTDRQIRFITNNPEKFWRNYWEGTKAGWKGVSPTGEFTNETIRPRTFKSNKNPLSYLERSLGAVMQGPDHAFARQAYGEALGTFATNLGKKKGMTNKQIQQNFEALADELDANIFKMADDAAPYATFQNKTNLGTGTSHAQKALNLGKRFGVGNLVIPFAKTPAAIITRAFDYSPLGFLRAGYNLLPLAGLEKGAIRQRAAQQALGRAIVGTTGLTGLGYWLSSNGILTGAEPYEARRGGLEEAEGRGSFKLNWDALQRFIKSGFDKDAAQIQPGDKLVDYNWFQPASISVAMGAEFAKALEDNRNADMGKAERVARSLQRAIVSGGGKALLESPFISGIKDVAKVAGSGEGFDQSAAEDIAVNGLSQFIPALLNRSRMGAENQRRETFGRSFGEKLQNMAMNKVPGLSADLPQSYGTFGQERQYMSGEPNMFVRALNAAINPASTTTYSPTPETEAVRKLYDATKDKSVLPKKATKTPYLKFPGEKKSAQMKLTNEQYSEYSRELGEDTVARIREKLDYLNSNATNKDKVAAVQKLIDGADKAVRERLAKEWGKRTPA